MRKKRILFLALLLGLVLVLLPRALANAGQPVSVFSVEVPSGASYDGYLVSVRPGPRARLAPLSARIEEVAENIYLAESVEDIRLALCENQILYIEPNFEIALLTVPNDPLFGQQWCMIAINAPILWDRGITGAGVRVGIIDSGLIPYHEDLDPQRVAPGFNFLNETTDTTDSVGHGTEVAGIIAATRDNGRGIAGLLSEVTIIPLKTFDDGQSSLDFALRAMNDAVDVFDVDVLNLSWGISGGYASQILAQTVDRVVERGVLVVAAAGNDGNSANIYPAALPNVVSVGAVDRNGNVANFSQRNAGLTVMAPGVDVWTLGHRSPGNYLTVRGTSFSAPFVTAMAAAARSVDPDINQAQFMDLLRRSAVPRQGGFNATFGHGVIDMNRFLAVLPGVVWFNDIATHWARADILNVAELGLFSGVGGAAFAPNQTMNRAMFVTALGRLYREMGGNLPNLVPTFADNAQIPNWASPYVAWAASNGIVTGYPGNRFMPLESVTREQAATFLARFAAHLGMNTSGNQTQFDMFRDGASVSGWASPYMAWAVQQGLITGFNTSGGMELRPRITTTRAEVAVLLGRFMNDIGVRAAAA